MPPGKEKGDNHIGLYPRRSSATLTLRIETCGERGIGTSGGAHIHIDRSAKLTLEHQLIIEKPDIVGSYEETGANRYKQSAFAIRRCLKRRMGDTATFVTSDESRV